MTGRRPRRLVFACIGTLALVGMVPAEAQDPPPLEAVDDGSALPDLLPEPGEEPSGAPVLDDWTATSRTYETEVDGVYVTQVFPSRANFRSDGEWTPIDTSLVDGGELGLEPAATNLGLTIAEEGDDSSMVAVELADGSTVGFGMEDAAAAPVEVEDSTAVYEDIAPGVDLELEAVPTGVKETIVLDSPAAGDVFSFPLEVDGLTPRTDGRTVEFVDADGDVRLVVPAGYMVDSAATAAESEGVTYALVDGGRTLEVSLDRAWLDDADRVYPVRVDPSLLIYAGNFDTYVNEVTPGDNTGSLTLNVGRGASGYRNRAFLRFNVSSLTGMNIYQATLNLWQSTAASCTPVPTDVYAVTGTWPWGSAAESWPGPTVDTGEVYGTIQSGSGFSGACPSAVVSTDLSRLVDRWSTGEVVNRGISLRARDESVFAQFKKFASAETYVQPSVDILWNDPTYVGSPVPPTVLDPDGVVSTGTPTLSTLYLDPDGDDGSVRFWLYDRATGAYVGSWTTPEVASGDVASVTLSSNLVRDKVYELRAHSRDDGMLVSSLSGSTEVIWPSIAVTAPGDGTDVTGTTTVTAAIDGGVTGATSVNFSLDGTFLSSDASPPYTASVNTTTLDDGPYTVTATIVGGAGAGRTSPPVTMMVANDGIADTAVTDTAETIAVEVPVDGPETEGVQASHCRGEGVEPASNKVCDRINTCIGNWVHDPERGSGAYETGTTMRRVRAPMEAGNKTDVRFTMVRNNQGVSCAEEFPLGQPGDGGIFQMRLVNCTGGAASAWRTWRPNSLRHQFVGTEIVDSTCFKVQWSGTGDASRSAGTNVTDNLFRGRLSWEGCQIQNINQDCL